MLFFNSKNKKNNNIGIIDEHECFNCFTNVSDILKRKEFFKIINGDKLIAKAPLSWKKSFVTGVVSPHEKSNCGDCKKGILCGNCDKLLNQRKEFSANKLRIS